MDYDAGARRDLQSKGFSMDGSRFRFPVRFRLRSLLVLMAIAAAWVAWNTRWIRQRHDFIAEKKASYARRGGDPAHYHVGGGTAQAPMSLWLLGERGFEVLQFDVYVEHYDENRTFGSYREIQQQQVRARILFPEVTVIDIEPVAREGH